MKLDKKNIVKNLGRVLIFLGIVFLLILIGNFYKVNKGIISEKEAGQLIIDLADLQEIELLSVERVLGLYKVTFLRDGIETFVYVTLDGKNFISCMVPFSDFIQRIKQEKESSCGG